MVTEEEDKNNKEYASEYARGRSGDEFRDFLVQGGRDKESTEYKAYRDGEQDRHEYGWKSSDECGSGETDTSSDSCCYITSACLDDLGLSRNSPEMKVMKDLTKNFTLKSFSGKRDYITYGRIAPLIVQKIRASNNCLDTWKQVYGQLQRIVPNVEKGKYQEGFNQYKSLVLGLEAQFMS
ncbi:MAG: hypothetical protein WC755_09000 [Candidatus Woesearchaeota archaeon]|jgi:hypothetical protein